VSVLPIPAPIFRAVNPDMCRAKVIGILLLLDSRPGGCLPFVNKCTLPSCLVGGQCMRCIMHSTHPSIQLSRSPYLRSGVWKCEYHGLKNQTDAWLGDCLIRFALSPLFGTLLRLNQGRRSQTVIQSRDFISRVEVYC